jgi:carbon storage regulator
MLVLARKLNERIMIGDSIELSILEIKGDQVKIGIQAPNTVKVYRYEVFSAIQEENKLAAQSSLEAILPELPKKSQG